MSLGYRKTEYGKAQHKHTCSAREQNHKESFTLSLRNLQNWVGLKKVWQFLKVCSYLLTHSNFTPRCESKKAENICSHKNFFRNVCNTVFAGVGKWREHKCPSTQEWRKTKFALTIDCTIIPPWNTEERTRVTTWLNHEKLTLSEAGHKRPHIARFIWTTHKRLEGA